MQFLLHLYRPDLDLTPDQMRARGGAYAAYDNALREAGVLISGDRVRPPSEATQVRVKADGAAVVLDGPYAETKEQLAGYYLIDVENLEAAIAWAARCPAASEGTVEVRQLWPVPAPTPA